MVGVVILMIVVVVMVGVSKVIRTTMKGIKKARRDYKKELRNLSNDVKKVPKEFWDEIRKKAEELGIGVIGFAPIDENFDVIETTAYQQFIGNIQTKLATYTGYENISDAEKTAIIATLENLYFAPPDSGETEESYTTAAVAAAENRMQPHQRVGRLSQVVDPNIRER